ncbi:MAG: tetratricopeptide repeat protein [Nitrospiraceae bacterium]
MKSNSLSMEIETAHTRNTVPAAIRTMRIHNLIERYRAQGKYVEMEPLCQLALEIEEQTLGPEHFEVALTLSDLAGACHLQGKYAKAEPLYKRSLAIWEKTLGKEHPRVATAMSNLAKLCAAQGNYTRAEQFYLCSLAIRKKTLGPDHPDVALNLKNMAELYQRWSLATLRIAG